ncbi:hypothetical protein HY604_01455 [Candidatus Peregrinibacteria bacterium]|nr:hypothetical protein [Candidatus Peregrinibacteria bacterium]
MEGGSNERQRAVFSGREAIGSSGSLKVPANLQRIALALSLVLVGCEGMGVEQKGQSGTATEPATDNTGAIVSNVEKERPSEVRITSVVLRNGGLDVFLVMPENVNAPLNISFALLRGGGIVETGMSSVEPGTNPFKLDLANQPMPGDRVEIAPEGGRTFEITLGNSSVAAGEMP